MTSRSHSSRSRGMACLLVGGLAATAAGSFAAAQGATAPAPAPAIPKGNHYQCYAVPNPPPFRPRTVTLTDEFGTRRAQVLGITRLCNPATKRFGNAVYEPVDKGLHYVCYKLSPADSKSRTVQIVNQFDNLRLTVGPPQELCVPTAKKLLQ